MHICWVGAHQRRSWLVSALLVLGCAAVLFTDAASGGPALALAAPTDKPPVVVGDSPDLAKARIEAWSPPDGSRAAARFSPAIPPDNTGGVAIVVRQGAPESGNSTGRRVSTVVPLTLGVTMPDLVGSTRSTTAALLARFALTSVTWLPTDAADGDDVTGQSPPPGTLVAFADPVVVSFTRNVPVPNVLGLKVSDARTRVDGAGLLLETSLPAGRVIDQQPAAGTLVPGGSTVVVTVDAGTTVPNVLGLTVEQARQAVEQAGLVLDTPSADGLVTGQRPRAGRSVARGRTVAVTVEPLPLVTVPDVLGMPVREARETLEQAGLRMDAPDIVGDVIGQRPRAGTSVAPGTSIAVTIAVPPPADRRLLVGAVAAGLVAVGASVVTARRWRRRRWIAHHVRVTPTSDPGHARRRDAATTPSWRITVRGRPGPPAAARARKVTHADTSR